MFGSKKPETWPAAEWRDRLDQFIGQARRAGVGLHDVANTLEAKAAALRMSIAVMTPSDRSIF